MSNENDPKSDQDNKSLGIIASKGTLDMAYPPLILGTTAASFGWDVMIFFTFWGLDVIHENKSKNLKVSPVANPSMTIPGTDIMMPNIVGMLPGMTNMATGMMKSKIDSNNVSTIPNLLEVAKTAGVDLLGCQMTMDLFEYTEEDLIDGAEAGVGASTALDRMAECDIQLLI